MSVIHGTNYGTPTLDLNFAKNKSLIDTVSGRNYVTFSRAQANYLTTYVGADGLIKYASANEPRFDHNPLTGECLGLLVEEQRINLLRQSIPENGLTRDQGIFSANAAIAPDGTLTASLVTTGAYSSRWGWFNNYGDIPISGGFGVISFYAKSNGSPWVGVACGLGNPWEYSNAAYNLVTGASRTYRLNTHGYEFKRATAVGNGWFRVEFDVITPSNSIPNGSHLMFNTALSGSGGNLVNSFAGDGVSGAYFWGLQVESGSFATSLIPTSGSTVTRSADNAEITGTNFSRWYNQSEGTWFGSIPTLSGSSGRLVEVIGPGASDYSLSIRPRASSSRIDFARLASGASQINVTFPVKIAASYNSASIQGAANGTLASLVTSGSHSNSTSVDIGRISSENTYLGGTISRLTYYPTRLQNYQLQQLTK